MNLRQARNLVLVANGLATEAPFGRGKPAALAAIRRLGYVQIDTIHVIERAHHHIIGARVPDYRPAMLAELMTFDRAVFEYWTHALAILPVEAYRYFLRDMRAFRAGPRSRWFSNVTDRDVRATLRRLRKGPLSIRDIDEDRVEKDHEWASRKPTKRVLEFMFYAGLATVRARHGMVKEYELASRHFGWKREPRLPTAREEIAYRLDRALDAQGVVSLETATYADREHRETIAREIARRVRAGALVELQVEGLQGSQYARLECVEAAPTEPEVTRVLSPFDPLVIQRKRVKELFGFDYTLECYVPAVKRKWGYFVCPVLDRGEIVARLDLKADREARMLRIQSWHWERGVRDKRGARARVESELGRFAGFQFGG